MQQPPNSGNSGGSFFNFNNPFFRILLKILLFIAIGAVAIWQLPEYAIFIIISLIIILILSSSWIRNHQFLEFLLIVILIVLILFVLSTKLLENFGIIGSGTVSGVIGEGSNSWTRFIDSMKNFNPLKDWSDYKDRQVAIATGNHFTGQVEQSKDDVELGLQLEKLESYGMDIIEGQEAVFWVTLKGKTLGDNIINGLVDCNASEGNEMKTFPTSPTPFSIYSYEMNQYECRFSSLPGGKSIKINFWAEYNFRTLGYKKAYFIDQDRLRTLRSLNQDPLREAGISDRNPVSVYTNGPINIGIGTSDYQPIPVRENDERLFILGITLQTKPTWKGQINKINELEIQIHKSMYIQDPNACDHQFVQTDETRCKERCENNEECILQCGDYNFYRLTDNAKEKISEIKDYRTFKCPIYTYTRDDLLGNTPLSTRFVRVVADYNYKSEIERLFFVKKAEEIG